MASVVMSAWRIISNVHHGSHIRVRNETTRTIAFGVLRSMRLDEIAAWTTYSWVMPMLDWPCCLDTTCKDDARGLKVEIRDAIKAIWRNVAQRSCECLSKTRGMFL